MNEWGRHVEGACAEFALAKFLNVAWEPAIGKPGGPDLRYYGHRIEVKWSSYQKPGADLYLPRNTDRSAIAVLLKGKGPNYIICGWTYAADVMIQENWNVTPRGEYKYVISENELMPIEILESEILRANAIFA